VKPGIVDGLSLPARPTRRSRGASPEEEEQHPGYPHAAG